MSRPTLPGTLPGLLRRGSPVVDDEGNVGVVICVLPGCAYYAIENERGDYTMTTGAPLTRLSLDLSDATGRVHAAWWAGSDEHKHKAPVLVYGSAVPRVIAQAGRDLSDSDIARLRDLCLALGGAS